VGFSGKGKSLGCDWITAQGGFAFSLQRVLLFSETLKLSQISRPDRDACLRKGPVTGSNVVARVQWKRTEWYHELSPEMRTPTTQLQ